MRVALDLAGPSDASVRGSPLDGKLDVDPTRQEGEADPAGPDFASLLEQTVSDANRLQHAAASSAAALAAGKNDDLHGTMITSKEAEISLKLVGSIRNRLLDAFHELWRINL
jgi:flagellar hook-basal body complex protein FliE